MSMNEDPTEATRREMLATNQPQADLAATKDQTWTTAELQEEFDVIGFAAPFVVVVRKSDNVQGLMEFTHSPRIYFGFQPEGELPVNTYPYDNVNHDASARVFEAWRKAAREEERRLQREREDDPDAPWWGSPPF